MNLVIERVVYEQSLSRHGIGLLGPDVQQHDGETDRG